MSLNLISVNKYKTCKLLNIKDMMNNLQSSAFVARTTQLLSSVVRLRLLLMMLLTLTASANAWGADATISTFTSTSSKFGDVSYTAYKGGGTSNPAVNSSAIRLYQNSNGNTGGYIVLSVPDGYTITSATIKSTMATTTGYYIDSNPGATTPAKANFEVSNKSLSANTAYTVSGLSTQYITFACFGTSSSSRLYVSHLSVTYQSAAAQTYNVTLSRNGVTETISDIEEGTALDDIDGTGDQGGCSPDWEFEGWSKTQRSAQNNTEVMDLVTTVDGAGPYYAVYSHTAEGGGGSSTATMSSFSAVSGNVNNDTNVSYEAAKGAASTAPAIYSNVLRIYQNGGTLTITGNNEKKLTSITIGSSMATSVSYKIDGGTESSNQSIAANGKFTLSEIEASSVLFTCKGTTSSSRLYLNYLSVTYSGGNTVYYTTSPLCATQTAVTLSQQGGSGGTTSVTATYGQPMPTITPPTLAGYDFQGYYTANGGSGIKYYNADGTSAKDWDKEDPTCTLIAYWKAKTYTVTLNNQGATTAGATSVTATYNAAMPSIASNLPQKTGYTFNGYFDAASGGTQYYKDDGTSAKKWDKTANTTLYAQWTCETPEFDIKIKDDNPVVFSGESIELTVDGSNIAADATYQWYKYNGTTYDELPGQKANELTIAEATANDAGNYKCVVTNGTCSAENNYTVKMYHIKGLTDAGWEESFEFVKSGDKEGSFAIELAATTTYYFKLNDGSVWYWNEGTMTHNNCTGWVIEQEGADTQGKANTGITTTASGTYTFTLNYEDPSKPKLSVTYPQKKMVYLNPGNWSCPKYAVYSWDGDGNSTVLMTKIDDCADRNIYQAEIDASHSNVIFIGGTASYNVANTWANVSYQTIDLTYPSDDKVLYEINTTHLFLVPNSNWKQSNARFAAYFFGNGETWVSMTKVTADLYKVAIPTTKTYPSVIFCRMNPSAAANNWNNKWNQSADLPITKGKNHYTVAEGAWDKGDGTWKTAGDWTAFTPNYTVTFDANGHGTAPADQCIAEGGKVTTPTAPTATGYTFGGWYKEAGCTNAWDFANDVVTSDITLYAKWTVNSYTVTWNPAGGNWAGNTDNIVQTYEYDAKINAPDKPAYDCHEFVAWNPVYTVGKTMPAENLEFTATWNKLSYTITFKNYDGTVLQTSTVECGETPTYTGATPTREQTVQYTYTFSGWSPALYPADKDQEYTAQFNTSTRQYTVTWYDGTGNAHKTQTAGYNATVALPTTNPASCDDDYPHFIGWTADPIVGSTTTQPELVANVKVTGDCDYYAVFAKGAGGSSNYQKVTSALDDWSGEYLIVYETGKVAFNGGLSTLDAASNTIDVTISDNTIESNSTTDAARFTIAAVSGGYTIKSASGYYIGRTADSNGLTSSNSTAYTNTISYSSSTISIKGSGNGASTTLKYNATSGQNRFRYYKSGQQAIALYKKGSGVNYTSFITTCCTSWTAPTLIYPTELEENGTADPQLGAGTTHGTVTYASSNPSILSVNSTTGEITAKAPGTAKITATWSGDATYCSVSSTSNVITVKGSFSVIYYSNGGTGTMPNQKADENNVIAQLNANQFTRDGYAFVGWNTKANGTGTAYADQATNITLTQNLTLYAQWAAIVTLNDAGTETTTHPATAGGTITLPDGANACDPYEFVGWTAVAIGDWNEGINEPALVATTYTPSAPTTLYAVYKIQSEGNANAFKLSFESSYGKTYYVGEYGSSPYLRGFSNITKDEAVTFIRTKMYPNDDTKYYIYMEHEEEYLYCSSGNLYSTSSNPSESQGWVFHTVGDKIQIQAINQERYLSFADKDYDDDRINITTHQTGNQKSFNMLSAVTSTYVASPLCNQEITITFETGNGDFVDNAPATNPLTVTMGETITLPTCEYPGYEFMGWLKDEQQLDPSDIPLTYYTGDYTVNGTSSTITFYAYYKAIPEEVEFTGKDDVELLMYYYDGTANYYYAVSHAAERGELSSKQNCFNATTWTFTNVGNMQYHIQDETGKYLGAYSDGDNDLILSATPKVWTFTEVNGLWKMVCENSPSRALMYISTGKTFTNAAISNEGNGAYSYVTLGICPYPTYTTNPVLTQGFVVTNTAMVTSAVDQKVKAANALTLETRNIELPCTFTITAPNITFYDNTGAEVTQLTASAASEQFELYFAYKPTAENTMEYPTITIVDDELKTYTIKNRIQTRSLPATFAIVAKVGNLWYALPSQGLNSTTPPAAYPVEVDNMADPTTVTAVPANADWSLRGVYEASRSDATKDRYVANGDNLVFVNNASPAMALNASTSGNYLLTDAQYANYYQTNPGLYEWTPTTTDLETYQLTNEQRSRTLSVNTATVFGVHATDKAVEQVRFLPIQNRYTPAALQVVEWKENSVVIMYNGNPAQTASVSVNGAAAQNTTLSAAPRDTAVYELAANGLAANPTQRLSITIGAEKVILSIPYIISGNQTDYDLLPGSSVSAKREAAKIADLIVLNAATLTAAGAKSNPYKFRNVTIYGGGKLVIPSDKGFGVSSLTMRVGAVESGNYKALYPQLILNGSINTGNINIDYLTTYDRYYALSLPYEVATTDILYPTDIYGDVLNDGGNKASFALQWYDGEARASETRKGWTDLQEPATLEPYKGYTFWGAPRKVSVNGKSKRQNFGIHRIPIKPIAEDLITGETSPKQIDVKAHPAANAYDAGWNFIGNPYLAQYGNMEDGHTSGLLGMLSQNPETGVWEHTGNYRYITLTDDGKTYWQTPVSEAELYPFNTFFVQAGNDGAVQFSASNRASLPARRYAAQQESDKEITTGIILTGNNQTDRTGLLIADNFTEEYDFNADLSKFENSGINLYTIGKTGNLAYMAINQALAEQPIPVGYTAPAEGLYTIAFDEDRYNATDISALYLIDYDSNEKTNLLYTDYSFVTVAGTNNQRFALQVAFAPENATNVEWVGDATVQVGVEGNMLILNNLPTDAAVHVFDALGRLMYHTPHAPTEMQLTLPTGYYLVRIADKQHAAVINTVIP